MVGTAIGESGRVKWWICYRYREVEPPYRAFIRVRRLDDAPAPMITATGILSAGGTWWIEESNMPPKGVRTRTQRVGGSPDKPAYRVPLLTEIREITWNGLNVASTFAGAGGSSTGYRMAGYRVLAAVEFVPAAQNSYAANMSERTTLLRRDIRRVTAKDMLRAAGVGIGELDVLDGSPPCEPFSTAGRRDATWNQQREYSGQTQRTDDLFYEFARLVEGMQPRVFVAENVTGLVKGRAKGYFKRIMTALRACGYSVEARVLDASWLGVPQSRQRVIFIGVRNDLERTPAWPAPLAYQFTVRDAIGDLLEQGSVARMGSFQRKHDPPEISDVPAPTVVAGDSPYWHVDEVEQVYRGSGFVEETRSLDDVAPTIVTGPNKGLGANLQRRSTEPALVYDTRRPTQSERSKSRDRLNEPAPTVMASNVGHHLLEYDQQTVGNEAFEPVFGSLEQPHTTVMAAGARTSGELRASQTGMRRRFTIAELRRICGFPDDYVLTGSFSQQWERLGDAVPPPMMMHVAATIRSEILAQ